MLPRRRQPTRLPRPWDSPGKNTGVGCHFLPQCIKVKSESEVAQSYPTLSDPMDCSPPGSSVHGIFQARVLEWGAIALSGGRSKTCLFSSSTKVKQPEAPDEDILLFTENRKEACWSSSRVWMTLNLYLSSNIPWLFYHAQIFIEILRTAIFSPSICDRQSFCFLKKALTNFKAFLGNTVF